MCNIFCCAGGLISGILSLIMLSDGPIDEHPILRVAFAARGVPLRWKSWELKGYIPVYE